MERPLYQPWKLVRVAHPHTHVARASRSMLRCQQERWSINTSGGSQQTISLAIQYNNVSAKTSPWWGREGYLHIIRYLGEPISEPTMIDC